MSGHTKTRRIRKSNFIKKRPKERSISWREVFKDEIDKYTEAGLMLRSCRITEELTQKDLAEIIGVSQHHISEMEHGKRPIGKTMAKKLGEFFKVDYRRFL